MSKTLILIRHAHRDTEDPARDNGLSDKGREQVKRLVEYVHRYLEKEHAGEKAHFLSSPKKRCRETLEPIAAAEKREIKVDPRLSEYSPIESHRDFEERMESFIDDWKYEGHTLTVACSHGDWIPVCIQKLSGARIGLKKAGIVMLRVEAGEVFLTQLIQKIL
ncbi:MAG: histidine phosphatase family protein [Proteobacteria bacterium]|nr:histidine phosphatase family protein [Pseudomonadota bacterium]